VANWAVAQSLSDTLDNQALANDVRQSIDDELENCSSDDRRIKLLEIRRSLDQQSLSQLGRDMDNFRGQNSLLAAAARMAPFGIYAFALAIPAP
jgi:hypothetical protein